MNLNWLWRFIPAHAGNTRLLRYNLPMQAVYPRACGEHQAADKILDDDSGLSPRMRGTHKQWLYIKFSARFIPAHAGNTLKLYSCL